MNFIEKNTKKVALILGLITAFTAVTTVYAASNSDGWHDGVYMVNGEVKTQWHFEEEGGIYYLNEEGRPVTGWNTISESTYYFNAEGKRVSGECVIDGYRYTFQKNGKLLIGWQEDNTCYYTQYGVKVTGRQVIDGKTYHFNEEGMITKGWVEAKEAKYYYQEDGTMATGKKTIDEKVYYFDEDGKMVTGWKELDGKDYYFKKDGSMAKGEVEIDGESYYFQKDGSFKTGWVKVEDEKRYYDEYGYMCHGWEEIDGDKYYFNEDGFAYTNTEYDGYEFDEDGVATEKKEEPVYTPNYGSSNGGSYNPVGNVADGSAASIASAYVGSNYVWGGSSPAGFDCSGLVYYAYASAGVSIPRSGYGQAYVGSAVSYDNMQAGDILIWNGGAHVSIYVGGGQMVHATNPYDGVINSNVGFWQNASGQVLTGIRRP